MNCSPLIAYVLVCIAFYIPYPKYSLTTINMIGNLITVVVLYYLCKIGWKRLAWGIVVTPLLFITIFMRKSFDQIARSFEK
jgi:hypothetical protein